MNSISCYNTENVVFLSFNKCKNLFIIFYKNIKMFLFIWPSNKNNIDFSPKLFAG